MENQIGTKMSLELENELKLILETDNGIEKIDKSCECNQSDCCQFCNLCVEHNSQKDFGIIKDEKEFCINIVKYAESLYKIRPNPKEWTREELNECMKHLYKEFLKEFLQHRYEKVCTDCAEKIIDKKIDFIVNEWDKEKRKELYENFTHYVFEVEIDNEKEIYKNNRMQELSQNELNQTQERER